MQQPNVIDPIQVTSISSPGAGFLMRWLSQQKAGARSSRTLPASGRYWSRPMATICSRSWISFIWPYNSFATSLTLLTLLPLIPICSFIPWRTKRDYFVCILFAFCLQCRAVSRCFWISLCSDLRESELWVQKLCCQDRVSVKAPSLHPFPSLLPSEGVHWRWYTIRRPRTSDTGANKEQLTAKLRLAEVSPESGARPRFGMGRDISFTWRRQLLTATWLIHQVEDLKLTWFLPQTPVPQEKINTKQTDLFLCQRWV